MDKGILENLYVRQGLSAFKVGKALGFSKPTIYRYLRKFDIPIRVPHSHRKHQCDQNFFNKIDTENKAYFLGFLYADGAVSSTTNAFSINLQEEDTEIIQSLKEALKCDYNIKKIQPSKEFPNRKIQSKMVICSQKLKNALISLGCVPKKSSILTFPNDEQVPDNLIHHFIRGYFDGDGSVSLVDCLTPSASLVGTKSFIKGVSEHSYKNIGMTPKLYFPKSKYVCIGVFAGRYRLLTFLDWIYQNATIYLPRKFNRYMKLKNKQVNNTGKKYGKIK